MRRLYKTDEYAFEVSIGDGGKSKRQERMSLSEGQALVDSGEVTLYDSLDALNDSISYQENRIANYPPIEDQLDKMYHDGFDAWKDTIKAIKDAHPKP